MRFHVVGAGAIGGITGAFLARDGEDVTFVDVVPEHVAAINADGLFVDGAAGELRVRAPACSPADLAGPLDVVLLAVKSAHTMQALAGVEPHLGPDSLVVSLQNGLNPDRIAARIGAARTAGAFINFAADYIAPGHIRYGGAGDYYLGRLDGPVDARLRAIAERFGRFMPAYLTDNIMGYLWSKECYGSLLIGTALVDAPVQDVVSVPENREVLTAAVVEAVRLADDLAVRLEPFEPFDPALFRPPLDPAALDAGYARIAERFRGRVKQHTGIWRDLRIRRRKTEVEWLAGELVRRGAERGVALPVNARMVAMIAEIERGERPMAWENLRELRAAAGAAPA
ncbi:MAG TPA: 2-dehydropantoate 2-reductase [Thermomicrobiaceae bacterium]|nr:2-dehydropantoate 2-reductase [Thermomicrobiaceae bacterium]